MLRTPELAVLASLRPGDAVTELATRLERSESHVSRTVSALEERGLVSTERDGRYKRVTPSDASAVELLRDLVHEYPHVDLPELLTGTTIEVLYHFDGPSTVAELADRSGNYRNTVHRIVRRLERRGLVGGEDGTYDFNGEFDRLHQFARALVHHDHRRRLESVAPQGVLLWETDDEFLARTGSTVEAEQFHETGLARFREYGLQFLLPEHRHYRYSERDDATSAADLVCHALVIDDGPRYRSYCLLLLAAVDVDADELRERAAHYGVESAVEDLLRYREARGDVEVDGFPPWQEVEGLADEYEVTL